MAKKKPDNTTSRNNLQLIVNKLIQAPRVESSKVQYAKEKNLRKMKKQIEDWDKGNKPEKLEEYWKKRNDYILELAKEGNISVTENDTVIHILQRMPEVLRKKFNEKNEKLRTDEIVKLEQEYASACDNDDIEFDPHMVSLSDFPPDYTHTEMFFDIIEET